VKAKGVAKGKNTRLTTGQRGPSRANFGDRGGRANGRGDRGSKNVKPYKNVGGAPGQGPTAGFLEKKVVRPPCG